ncbi:MAG TPA: hypothetical protein VHS58_01585 [Acetobacteraceae bacterium]|jgi:threonine dehydrogenase-like Zn-dependent dehydrogenase|nr:hypothetical protein [Acetobacteraceae bacterium]
MSAFHAASAANTIFDALSTQARVSFAGVVGDVERDVIPTMAMLAQNLVVIGARRADGTYSAQDAADELEAQVDAAASVIVRFANEVLAQIQALLNALLAAVKSVVNAALPISVL